LTTDRVFHELTPGRADNSIGIDQQHMPLRVLLTQHQPLDGSASSRYTERLAAALRAAGHQVRLLLVDRQRPGDPEPDVRRVVCDPTAAAAELKFELPGFDGPPGSPTFASLSDQQLSDYRSTLRESLDDEVANFDPHVIHSQHVWIQGHLALEAGAPYVLSVWGPELAALSHDARYRRCAQEAAENAGRIIAADAAVAKTLRKEFGELDQRIVVLGDDVLAQALSLYEAVLKQRFGPDFNLETT
jgi:hypothetical protein